MQQQLFSDPAAAHVFDRLHSQALHLLGDSCTDAAAPAEGLSVLDVSLPTLLSPAHFDAGALSQALQHVGHSASASALRGCSSADLERHVRTAAAAAARHHKVTQLQVLIQLSRRYIHVRAAEGAALTLVDLWHGRGAEAAEPADGALAAPLLLRRGVGVSCVRVAAHPGSTLLKPVEPPLQVPSPHAPLIAPAATFRPGRNCNPACNCAAGSEAGPAALHAVFDSAAAHVAQVVSCASPVALESVGAVTAATGARCRFQSLVKCDQAHPGFSAEFATSGGVCVLAPCSAVQWRGTRWCTHACRTARLSFRACFRRQWLQAASARPHGRCSWSAPLTCRWLRRSRAWLGPSCGVSLVARAPCNQTPRTPR